MNKNQKFIIGLCMVIVCTLTILSGCDASREPEQNKLVEVHKYDCDNIEQELASEIKTAYCRFTCEKNYGGENLVSNHPTCGFLDTRGKLATVKF